MDETIVELDTPAGKQADWRFTHIAANDENLTVDEVVAHVDPQALGGSTPAGYVERQRWFATLRGPGRTGRIVDVRSESPFDVDVTYELDDGGVWHYGFRVDEDPPHPIVQMEVSVDDDAPPEPAGPDQPIVHCVDHFFVALPDPQAGLDLLTERLGIPLAWPFVPNVDGTGNCGVELGNAQFELLNFDMYEAFKPHTPARVQGIAFEPPPLTDEFYAELDRRKLPHAPPMPWGVFTNVFFGGLIQDPGAVVFTCRYHDPSIRDRAARQAVLDSAGGGELGITGVLELVIGSTRPEKHVERWKNFLNPIAPPEPDYWRIGTGPAVRIVEDPEDAVREIVLGVRSPDRAAARVRELGAGTANTLDDGVVLDLPPLNGLVIRLVEG